MVKNLKRFEFVPIEYIVKKFERRYSQKEIVARIKKLTHYKLIARHPMMEAYRITFLGLDCMALRILVTKNIIKAVGDVVGIGKESEVYSGLSENDEIVAIKLYKIGKQSFRHVARFRGYYSDDVAQSSWLRRSIIAGLREKEALTILNRFNIEGVPKIYGGALHSVVLEFIDGARLNEIHELKDPENVFNQIIEIIRRAYKDASLVHGDLSEYNVIVRLDDESEKVYIIDWPQFVSIASPLSTQLLKRDIENIAKFFKRRFRLDVDAQEVFKYITGQ
uniref:non-specific serine/threonine protein kinase n=1 Tax=Ignisphaera aggregans TaxID=334771 RepID=A0A7C2V927_9CREN